ncbi:unnamed protein product [Lactuca virosa]|uniref:Pentatricopeptide repeat-containing protein n=1 Tax=Lactuca virosa TaxID=75947 RepID=A0AAU9LKN6_9ASTR|nr:unnamed protein product [Lactuca virosa]
MAYTCNRDIERLMKSESTDSALKLFDGMPIRNAVTRDTIISWVSRGTLSFYSQMVSQRELSSSTFSTVSDVYQGLQVHSTMIDCSWFIFDSKRNVATWNHFQSGFGEIGRSQKCQVVMH